MDRQALTLPPTGELSEQPASLLPGWERPGPLTHARRSAEGIELRIYQVTLGYYAVATSPQGYAVSSPTCSTIVAAEQRAERIGRFLAALLRPRATPAPGMMPRARPLLRGVAIPCFSELAHQEPQARGLAIRQLRRQLKLTKKALARIAGVSISVLRRLENGFGRTRLTSIRLIVAALKTVSQLPGRCAAPSRAGAGGGQ